MCFCSCEAGSSALPASPLPLQPGTLWVAGRGIGLPPTKYASAARRCVLRPTRTRGGFPRSANRRGRGGSAPCAFNACRAPSVACLLGLRQDFVHRFLAPALFVFDGLV